MLTKGIVEEVLSTHAVKVRIPLLDGIKDQPLATDSEDLTIATVCTFPNCCMNPSVGDIVFVAFEDNTLYKAVVLGFLSSDMLTKAYSDFKLNSLEVLGTTNLSSSTRIGEVKSNELQCLSGVRDNIQKQIDLLTTKIEVLEASIKQQ